MRASDADRDKAAQLLREHHAEGRLTAEEFDDRVDRALTAKTLGELDELLSDLPAIDLYRLPAAGITPAPPGARRHGHLRRRDGGPLSGGGMAWVAWTALSAVLFLVWAGTALVDGGAAWLPWFLLLSVPWAIYLLRRPR
jgi:hypothetical protein